MNQYAPLIQYLLSFLIPLIIKTSSYLVVFKWRSHKVPLFTCIILASALFIPTGIVGLPPILVFASGVGIAVFVLARYTDVPIVFEGVIIIFGIEIGFAFLDTMVISSLLPLL